MKANHSIPLSFVTDTKMHIVNTWTGRFAVSFRYVVNYCRCMVHDRIEIGGMRNHTYTSKHGA